eukprot:2457904-Pleurochrysis_carterae.AAC.2
MHTVYLENCAYACAHAEHNWPPRPGKASLRERVQACFRLLGWTRSGRGYFKRPSPVATCLIRYPYFSGQEGA